MNQAPSSSPHIIVATHGDLGRALVQAVESIAGPQPRIAYVTRPDRQPALVLVDMAGGTPWNTALRVARAAEQAGALSIHIAAIRPEPGAPLSRKGHAP